MIILFAFIFSALIVAFGIMKRKKQTESSSRNPELALYFETAGESPAVRARYLIRAAKTMIDDTNKLSDAINDITYLHDEKLVSDDYYNNHKSLEEELEIEKIIIESEAESLKEGFKHAIFSEAMKMSSDSSGSKKKKWFDEALYMKKRENLMKDLQTRLKIGTSSC